MTTADRNPRETALRLLLLAFPFPPARAVGAVRCANLAKQLSRLGWRITVVTIDPGLLADPDPSMGDMEAWFREAGVETVWTDHGLRMFLGGYVTGRWWERPAWVRGLAIRFVRWTGVDRSAGWIRPVSQACARFRPGDFDVVMASGPPYAAFKAAGRLGRRLRARVVLDYRDLWSMAPHDPHLMPWTVKGEQRLLDQASKVLVVSSAMARCLERKFGHAEKISVVTNGFDPEAFRNVVPMRFEQPTVVYAGTFYPPLRIIDPVLDALREVNGPGRAEGKALRLLYLGPQGDAVRKAAKARGVLRWVETKGRVPRQEVYSALKGAVAATVVTSVEPAVSPEVDSILTGKLFEAMGCGAPVLLVAPAGSEASRVVERTRAGRSFVGSDVEGMAAWLRERMAGDPVPVALDVQAYSWPQIARQVDRILRGEQP